MCQLGAVVFSRQRVFRQDGIRSHSDLNPFAKDKWPEEEFHNAEYDFVNREWGMANDNLVEIPKWAMPMLMRFEQENWANADMLMNFVLHAGTPEDRILVKEAYYAYEKEHRRAWDAYIKAKNDTWNAYNKEYRYAWEAYLKAVSDICDAYNKECRHAWCAIFAKPENRIPIWREE